MKFFVRISVIFLMFLLAACTTDDNQIQFRAMTNFEGGDTVVLDMDLKNVISQGITIPSKRQCDGGKFVFEFDGEEGKYYKIFYQNESYKFQEND